MYDRETYLKLIGIQTWSSRSQINDENKRPNMKKQQVADNKPVEQLNWEEFTARVAKCTLCDLYKTRTQTVFGVGNKQADLLIVGEAPGANEDKQGEPFVGRAGRIVEFDDSSNRLKPCRSLYSTLWLNHVLRIIVTLLLKRSQLVCLICTDKLHLLQPKAILLLGRGGLQHITCLVPIYLWGNFEDRSFIFGENKSLLL